MQKPRSGIRERNFRLSPSETLTRRHFVHHQDLQGRAQTPVGIRLIRISSLECFRVFASETAGTVAGRALGSRDTGHTKG